MVLLHNCTRQKTREIGLAHYVLINYKSDKIVEYIEKMDVLRIYFRFVYK